MNISVLFFCASVLLSCANARPDVSLGYRYNQGHSGGGGSFLQASGSIPSSYSPVAVGNSYFSNQHSIGQVGHFGFVPSTQTGFSGNQGSFGEYPQNNGGSSFGSDFNSDSIGFGGNTQFNSGSPQVGEHHGFQAPIVNKHFYVHTAPADDDQQEVVRHIQIGQPQKNYRVVFINTPSSNSAKAKIIADIAPTEEKTAIYVLSKKQNYLDVETEVNTPAPVNNKPEVFFIKYKTPEEAVHAQHAIKAQYDSLGGTSDVSNEGKIPISSVIGSLHSSHSDGGVDASGLISGSVQIQHTGVNTQQNYLPPNRKYVIKK